MGDIKEYKMLEIEGQILEIRFQNETNGYTVCDFYTEKFGEITVVRLFAVYY